MKHTRKISIVLVLVMVLMMTLAIIPASAATPTKLYLQPGTNWNQSGARFAAYFFGNGEKWVSMTKVSGETNLYEVDVPAGFTKVIFCRMNPSTTANNWNNKWNQTGDLTIPTNGNNKFTVANGSWDGATTTWSTYTPKDCQHSATDALLSNTATCTAEGKATYHCNLCNQDYTKDAAYLNHDFVDGDCSRCDVVLNTVYYDNANGWASVHFHTWSDAYDYTSWPGTAMTKEGNVWVASIPSDCTGIIFNNGNGGEGNQTADITIPTDGNNFYAAGAWTTYNPGCQHVNKEEREAIPATCKDPGKNAGVYCNDCQTYIEGGEATSVTDEHNYVDGICSVCNGIDLTYTITVYFENNWDWTGLSVYYWYNGGETAWPGQPLTEVVGQNADGKNIYKVVIPARVNGFLFVGTGGYGQEQSNDVLPGETGYKNCVCYYMTYDEATSTKPAGTYDYHVYDNACDVDCNVCGATRETEHSYDNACDAECNSCGATRETEHSYDNACDAECNTCGTTREVADHSYDNACDVDCNVCGAIREVAHNYATFQSVVIVDNVPYAQYACACGETVNNDVVTFKGCSIRYKDGATVEDLAIRFGYQIDPNVLQFVKGWSWDYSAVDGNATMAATKEGRAMREDGVTNLVLTNIPLYRIDGTFTLVMSITLTIDGVDYTFVDNAESRNLQTDVLQELINRNDPSKDYAQLVLNAFAQIPDNDESATPVEDEEENA